MGDTKPTEIGSVQAPKSLPFCTEINRKILAIERKNSLPFGLEYGTIFKQDCNTICDEAGGCGWFQPVFPWSMSDFKPGDKNMSALRHAPMRPVTHRRGAPCRNLRRRISGLGNGSTALRRFLFVHTRILCKTESGF